MDLERTTHNSGSCPLLGNTRSQWMKCDHSSTVNAVIALWTIAVDLIGQCLSASEGRSHEMRYASNGVRAPVKRIGIIAKFHTCGFL